MAKMTAAEVRAEYVRENIEPKVLDNTVRGGIAEIVVADILKPDWKFCGGAWAGWDFEHQDGTRLQLKQSAARPFRNSRPAFSIKWQTGHWVDGGTRWVPAPAPTRFARIYIFGWHGVTDETCDHADPAQWRFYVVPTKRLPVKKTITLAALIEQMGPEYDADALRAAVEGARRAVKTTIRAEANR